MEIIDSIFLEQSQIELGFRKTPNFSLDFDSGSQSADHDVAIAGQQLSHRDGIEKGDEIVAEGNANGELNDNYVVDYDENHVVVDKVDENCEKINIVHVDDVKEEDNIKNQSEDGLGDDVKKSEDEKHGLSDNHEDSNSDADTKQKRENDGLVVDVKESEDEKHGLNDNHEDDGDNAIVKMQKRENDAKDVLVDDLRETGDEIHILDDYNEDGFVNLEEKKKGEDEIKDKWGDNVPKLSGNDNQDGWGDYYMENDGLKESGDCKKTSEDYNGWDDYYIENEVVKKNEIDNNDGWGNFNSVDDALNKSGNDKNEWSGYNNVDDGWKIGVTENVEDKSTLTVVDEERSGGIQYPIRSDAEDCSFYLRTGTCKYGSICKFNHPLKKKHQNQSVKEKTTTREEYSENPGMIECKYYLSSGGCKFGNACRYNHSRGNPTVAPVLDLNFVGLPIRPGEKECSYYMRTGSCKYAASCRFNHPDPTSGPDPSSGYVNSSSHSFKDALPTVSSRSLSRTVNEPGPYVPMMFSPTQGISSQILEWNGVQTPTYPPDGHMRSSTAYVINNSATESNVYAHHQQHIPVEDFPERPGQPECSFFLKTGDCKYRSNCKFHHPKNHTLKLVPFAVTDNGLPLRPDQIICTHYSRYGICKFGPNCRFDHPTNI